MTVNRAGKRANLWVGGEAVADQGMSSISIGLKQNQTLTFAKISMDHRLTEKTARALSLVQKR